MFVVLNMKEKSIKIPALSISNVVHLYSPCTNLYVNCGVFYRQIVTTEADFNAYALI